MQFYFRLNYPADLDLIVLKRNMGRRFPDFVRKCLRSQILGKPFEYDPPGALSVHVSDRISFCTVCIRFDDKQDADLIEFINSIPTRSRGVIIKRFICGCCTQFPADLFVSLFKDFSPAVQKKRSVISERNPSSETMGETESGNEKEAGKPDKSTREACPENEKNKDSSTSNEQEKAITDEETLHHSPDIDSDDDMMSVFAKMINR